jgi:hypothetical protein
VSGKIPLTSKGLRDATLQEGKIGFWFRNYSNPGVAVACGHPLRSGGHLLVLDVDVQHDGDHSLTEAEAEHGELPPTWTVRSPSGGWHYYFRVAEPQPTAIGFRPGLELRCSGAYVVAPPSPGYSVEVSGAFSDVPAWLLALARRSREEAQRAPSLDETIPKGLRDKSLASLAGTLRRRGLVYEEILPTLLAVNARRCDPPLPEADLMRIATSYAGRAASAPLVPQRGGA